MFSGGSVYRLSDSWTKSKFNKHGHGLSITGGYVYRGKKIPALRGAYVYGDYVSGVILASRFDDNDEIQTTTLVNSDLNISAFGRDESGELYVVDYSYFQPSKGRLYRLAEQEQEEAPSSFPILLSETGCFSDVKTLALAEGMLSYAVNSPLWHDGARSIRAVSLPQDTTMMANSPGAWSFPIGSRFIKTFVYDQQTGPPVRVETRIMFVVVERCVRLRGIIGCSERGIDRGRGGGT